MMSSTQRRSPRRSSSLGAIRRAACVTTICLGVSAISVPAQETVPDDRAAQSLLKLSALTAILVPTFGVERPLADSARSFQWDVSLSPWASVRGRPLQFLIGVAEWRYYARSDRRGLYAGLHVGGALFRLQKWNYRDTTLYQEGGSVLAGGAVGGTWSLARGMVVDIWFGGGTVQSLYKGYDRLTHRRYDGAKLWNISGELLPYRTGIALGFPLRGPTERAPRVSSHPVAVPTP